MLIYNKDKTKILEDYDLNLGKLVPDVIHHKEVKAVEEQGHERLIREYPSGGKEVEWVIDVPAIEYKAAYDEDILVYLPYTQDELDLKSYEKQLNNVLNELSKTDYIANKLAEANSKYIMTNDKTEIANLRAIYEQELIARENWRLEADKLKSDISNLKTKLNIE